MAPEISEAQKQQLIEKAAEARQFARVPQSGFHVGAALLTAEGQIITGCNMEIKSTLYSICAERCALAKAVSMGYQAFVAIAVVSDAEAPVSPCGFCRQVLLDFGQELLVIMANANGSQVRQATVGQLVPLAFDGTAWNHD